MIENLFKHLFYTELHFGLGKQTAKLSAVYYAKAIIVNNENFYGEVKQTSRNAKCAP